MKFLADENFPRPIISRLRRDGHEVLWMVDIHRGEDDVPILRLAWNEGVVILTNDKDLQRHVLKEHHRAHGLVWLRLGRTPRALAVERTAEVIHAYEHQLLHTLTIIYPDRVEQEPLP